MTLSASDLLLRTIRFNSVPDRAALEREWAQVETTGLAQLAEFEGCTLWLYSRLQEFDLLGDADADFVDWLTSHARRIKARNLLIGATTDHVVALLAEAGIPHVLLKGVAFRAVADHYPHGADRITNDVDLLLPEEQAQIACDRLGASGFHSDAALQDKYDTHFHLPPLIGERGVAVEIHTSTSDTVSPAACWERVAGTAEPVQCAGGETRVPSATELLWHSLTHALVDPSAAFRLRFLQDAAAVCASGERIDLQELNSRLDSTEISHPALARRWLGAALALAGGDRLLEQAGLPDFFNMSRLLRWRLAIYGRVAEHSSLDPLQVWGTSGPARLARLLALEGTRVETGQPYTHPRWVSGTVTRTARSALALAARSGYRAWRLMDRARHSK